MFKEEFDTNTIKKDVRHHHSSAFENYINNMSSLQLYTSVRSSPNMASYLCSKLPFKAIKLKFKLCSKVLGLRADLQKQKRGDGMCKHCVSFESVRHFVLHCDA